MQVIVWDVDDVLNNLMGAWLDDFTASNSKTAPFRYEDLSRNPPNDLLGMSREEYLVSLDAFRLSGKAAKLEPVPEVFDWFSRYGDGCCSVALTAVPLCASHVSAEWVLRNFGRWVRSYNVVASPRPGDPLARPHATKSEFLRWWGKGDILIDDSLENVAGARSLGMHALLFPRPWNTSSLTIAETLEELAKFLAGE